MTKKKTTKKHSYARKNTNVIEAPKELPTENIQKPKSMPSHIEEYLAKVEGSKESFASRELFEATLNNIDLKTHLTDQEINLINTLMFNNHILKSRGLVPIYDKWLEKFMRLKVSKDRLSRNEFVNINRQMTPSEEISNISNLKNIIGTKQ